MSWSRIPGPDNFTIFEDTPQVMLKCQSSVHPSGTPVSAPILSDHLAVSKMTAWRRPSRLRIPGEKIVIMKRVLLVGAGLLITVAGVIFTLQGVGTLGGSVMSGATFWAAAGPVIALMGLAMVTVGLRRRFGS